MHVFLYLAYLKFFRNFYTLGISLGINFESYRTIVLGYLFVRSSVVWHKLTFTYILISINVKF